MAIGFFKNIPFRNKKNKIRTRNPFNLEINDIIEYDLTEYQVIGKITYEDNGYYWYDYHLFDGHKHLWFSAEDDDVVILGLFEKLKPDHELYSIIQTEIPTVINYEGERYSLLEKGRALIKAEGKVGASTGQSVEYWDFENALGANISVEKWGNELEISIGQEVKESLLDFYPAQ
ncbi:DUF4178 domain-containing protein [Natronospora cellulosivora (SeqCode)]